MQEASGQPIQSKSADSSKDTKRSEQAPAGTLQGVEATGKLVVSAGCKSCLLHGCISSWHLPKELLQSLLAVAAQLAKRSVHPAPAFRAVWLVCCARCKDCSVPASTTCCAENMKECCWLLSPPKNGLLTSGAKDCTQNQIRTLTMSCPSPCDRPSTYDSSKLAHSEPRMPVHPNHPSQSW